MYQNAPISERVQNMRKLYRNTLPKIDLNRYKLVTEYYQTHPQEIGILKRAGNLKNLFEKMPTPIRENERIVGYAGEEFRSSPLFPENSFAWFLNEMDHLRDRDVDQYILEDEDREYILQTGEFWVKNCMSAAIDAIYPEEYYRDVLGNGVLNYRDHENCQNPIGHFCGNFWTVVDKGLGGVLEEARQKKADLLEKGIRADDARRFEFYRAVEMVTEGIITYTKRYAAEALRQAELCTDEKRKAELLSMADSLNWIMEKPCRNYYEALQACYMYQLGMILDAQLHGISYGRLDQYVGKYAERDIAEGFLTQEEAQELTDLFMLKVAEVNRVWSERATRTAPGYTSGQMITLAGVDSEGNDVTNVVTYMVLQSSARLKLHNPPVTVRTHDGTPEELWDAAIETTKQVGGVPIFEADEVAQESLMRRGIPIEDARNYCINGCVEPCVCGSDFANSGGDGNNSYTILPAALWCAINNGTNPFQFPGGPEPKATGPKTGYLYEMESMEDVLNAYKTQMDYYTKWQVSMVSCYEYLYAERMPLPLLSATMTGCMESGLDVMWGGSKYNGAGNSSIGHGNVADSLNIIDQICFREKKATTRELYDALMANWEGYEDLHQYILGRCTHFGNDDPEADKYLKFVADTYSQGITRGRSVRNCSWSAGCWPVTLNVALGKMVCATPDGRKSGDPLSDGISPVQSMDKNGPFSTINSILKFDQRDYANGTLCNMKFHPTALQGADGNRKLRAVMESYFKRGGMELQLNIVSADTLRKAQQTPEEYQDLVVRIAGFSAYFVEVYKEAQDDLIRRTEMSV
ncbi:MAG: pyruvate formate lyase family protein [Lachnospiraceae bacterium]|nr:pyruvate formate lyase family protein [Lachnospiraceae bacterium]